jgi:hypothetical protein
MPNTPSEFDGSLISPVLSCTGQGMCLELTAAIYEQVERLYGGPLQLIEALNQLNQQLSSNQDRFNINPYGTTAQEGIYILGLEDSVFQLFSGSQLVLKGARGQQWGTENLRTQFHRSLQLQAEFALKLSAEERHLLGICPVYLYAQSQQQFFRQLLLMQRIDGPTLGQTSTGFQELFCRVFDIPSLEEIAELSRFRLHRWMDGGQHRQLLKIQAAYLFERLQQRGITLLSLNQKNIIETSAEKGRYVIIDPVPNYLAPISPAYNLLTGLFCR